MTVQFEAEVMDDSATLNVFWPRIREQHPNLVPQPPLPPIREDFGPAPAVTFQLMGPGVGSRFWFVTQDQAEVVQVQKDRFAFNWRKEPVPGGTVGEYPRYAYLRERFASLLNEFQEAVFERGLTPRVAWCEIAYINQIPATFDGNHRRLASILRLVNEVPLPGLPEPEDTAVAERHLLVRDGQPFGRFHINANTAFKIPSNEPIYVLNLTARGTASGAPDQGVLGFMDYGRNLIVHGFRDMTTDQMHAEWGLE